MDLPQTFVKHFPSGRRQMLHLIHFAASNDSGLREDIFIVSNEIYMFVFNKFKKKPYINSNYKTFLQVILANTLIAFNS